MKKKIICILIISLFFWGVVFARNTNWKTLKTTHFIIYYPVGSEQTAFKIQSLVEKAYNDVTKYLNYIPTSKIPISVDVDSDYMNGYFSIFPNKIQISESTGQNINFFENTSNPLYLLIVHELTHYVHITTAKGVYKNFCTILGSATCVLNMFSPGWLIEGLAVNAETNFTNGGRGRSGYFDSYARSFMEDKILWSLSASGVTSPYFQPQNRIYISGYYIVDYITKKYGKEAPAKISLYQGEHPFRGTKGSVNNLTKKSSKEFYNDFLEHFNKRNEKIKKKARKINLPQGNEIISEKLDNFSAFVWNKKGKIEAIKTNYEKKKSVVIISTQNKTLKIEKEYKTPVFYSGDFLSKAKDGKLIFRSIIPFGLQNLSAFKSDLFSYDFERNKLVQITKNKHIFSGDISKKSNKIVALKKRGTENKIVIFDENMKETNLFSKVGVSCNAPSWSFDEKQVVAVCKDKKGAKVTIINTQTKKVRTIEDDNFFKREASFSFDSKWIVFSSNKQNNIFNIYAYNIQTENLYQLTSTFYGAFSPKISPNGKKIAFLTFNEGLKKICVMDFNPKKGKKIGSSIKLQNENFEKELLADISKIKGEQIPIRTYIPSLHVPYFGYDDKGTTLGVFLMGGDPLALDTYQASISFGASSGKVDYDIFIKDTRLFPSINLRIYDSVSENNTPAGRKENLNEDEFFIREQGASLSANIVNIFQISPSTLTSDFEFGINYKKFESVKNYIVDKKYNSTVDYFAKINFNRSINQANRDVIPTGGQNFIFEYEKATKDFGGSIDAKNSVYVASQYFPSFFKNHGIEFKVAYQEQKGALSFSRDMSLPRGYKNDTIDLNTDKNGLLSLEYHFPIKYTDDGIGMILYHSFLVKGSFFVDWGAGFKDSISWNKFKECKKTSVGFTITNQINFMALFPLEYGLEVAYKTDEKEFNAELLFIMMEF